MGPRRDGLWGRLRAAARQSPGPNRSVSQRSSGRGRRPGADPRRRPSPGHRAASGGAPAAERERDLPRSAEAVAASLLDDEALLLDRAGVRARARRSRSARGVVRDHRLGPAGRRRCLADLAGEQDDDPARRAAPRARIASRRRVIPTIGSAARSGSPDEPRAGHGRRSSASSLVGGVIGRRLERTGEASRRG